MKLLVLLFLFLELDCSAFEKQSSKTDENECLKEQVYPNRNYLSEESNIDSLNYIVVGIIRYSGYSHFYYKNFKKNTFYETNNDLLFVNQDTMERYAYKINDTLVISKLNEIFQNVPSYIFNSEKSIERYGCPGCRDNPVIYIKIKKGQKKYYFYFDSVIKNLPEDKRIFIDFLGKKINELSPY